MKGVVSIFCFLAAAAALVYSIYGIPLLALWLACIFVQQDKRSIAVIQKVKAMLIEGETVILQGIQHRAFAFFSRRLFLVLTSSRIILIKRGLLGGFQMQDIQWKDLHNAQIDENVLSAICGSNLTFRHLKPAPELQIDGIEDQLAREMYAKAQYEEQAWAEKRRVRDLEEQRAMAGGVIVNTGEARGATQTASATDTDIFAKIEKSKQLLDMGAISDAEYQEMKAKILSGSTF